MAQISRSVVDTLVRVLGATNGVEGAVQNLALAEQCELDALTSAQVVIGNIPEKARYASDVPRYPVLQVYCDRVTNKQVEKFRSFSGKARVVLELQATDDRPEWLDRKTQLYVEAVTDVLERNHGDWGQGISYGGNYEVQFGPVKSGGRNYVQEAKIQLEVFVSVPRTPA